MVMFNPTRWKGIICLRWGAGLQCPLMGHLHYGRPWPLSWEKGPHCLWLPASPAAGPTAQCLSLTLAGAVGLFSLLRWIILILCFCREHKIHFFEYVNRQSTFNAGGGIILPLIRAYTRRMEGNVSLHNCNFVPWSWGLHSRLHWRAAYSNSHEVDKIWFAVP